MQIVIDIPKKTYDELRTVTVTHAGEAFAQKLIKYIKNGTPLEQESVIDKIRAEIDNIEINGHVRDVECFTMGIRYALNIIDKYKAEVRDKWAL